MTSTLYVGISELVQPHADAGSSKDPLSVTRDAALLVRDGVITAAGPKALVLSHEEVRSAEEIDLGGRAVIPGFVDSHTHVVHAGDRFDDIARRARGETYASIARAGGGIRRSVQHLAETSIEDIAEQSLARLNAMLALGTTTVEVKTGYGLTPELEEKHLEAIELTAKKARQQIFPTLLAHVPATLLASERAADPAREPPRGATAAHAESKGFEPSGSPSLSAANSTAPPPKAGQGAKYEREDVVRAWHDTLIPKLAKRVRFFDVFVEDGAFTPEETRKLCGYARAHGLAVKLHVDQLRDGGGAELAASLGALSADHLEHVSERGAQALAVNGVVACVLPGCAVMLRDWPNARRLRDAGCDVAIASDCNPGSSPVLDLTLCGLLAATQCGLTLDEALWGITRGGAKALGLNDRGRLIAGERADMVIVDHADYRAIFGRPGRPPVRSTIVGGVPT